MKHDICGKDESELCMFRMLLRKFQEPQGARRKRFFLFFQIAFDQLQQLFRIRRFFCGKIELVEKRLRDLFFIVTGCENAVDEYSKIGECLRTVSSRGREGKAFLLRRCIAGKIKLNIRAGKHSRAKDKKKNPFPHSKPHENCQNLRRN